MLAALKFKVEVKSFRIDLDLSGQEFLNYLLV